jgi:hypothetical protein
MTCTLSDGKRLIRARTSLPSGLNWALSRTLCGMVRTKCDGVPRGRWAPGKAATVMTASPLRPAYVDTAHRPSGANRPLAVGDKVRRAGLGQRARE